jgi:4-oxalocrotonate tautomerase
VTSRTREEVNQVPSIIIEGPSIAVERKRVLVAEMSQAAAKAYGMPKDVMIVLIKENPPENVGLGGQLLIDRPKTGDK